MNYKLIKFWNKETTKCMIISCLVWFNYTNTWWQTDRHRSTNVVFNWFTFEFQIQESNSIRCCWLLWPTAMWKEGSGCLSRSILPRRSLLNHSQQCVEEIEIAIYKLCSFWKQKWRIFEPKNRETSGSVEESFTLH